MEPNPEIKRRPDGSIDTGYYLQIGRDMRSAKAHEIAHKIVAKTRQTPTGPVRRLFSRMHLANA